MTLLILLLQLLQILMPQEPDSTSSTKLLAQHNNTLVTKHKWLDIHKWLAIDFLKLNLSYINNYCMCVI